MAPLSVAPAPDATEWTTADEEMAQQYAEAIDGPDWDGPVPDPAWDDAPSAALMAVQQVVAECFPDLWPAVEATLATAATLLLKSNGNPMALVLVGSASSGKTTVAHMIADHPLCYRSDTFTVASFVSQAANREAKQLDKVDLLPRIKHKVMVTPELAPIFRGKEDDLVPRFTLLTRVLDGQGLLTDAGTHGQRGYRGDYLFSWLGCTTPFDEKVWRVMAQLGSRLFFFQMDDHAGPTIDDLVALDEERPYLERLESCRVAVGQFLTDLFTLNGGVRGVAWDTQWDPKPVRRRIAQLATLLVVMRSAPMAPGSDAAPAKPEVAHRAYAILGNLARGRALVHDRSQLVGEDADALVPVVLSSMPVERRRVLAALAKTTGPITVSDVQTILDVRHHHTAQRVMEDLERIGLVTQIDKSVRAICLRSEWAWCQHEFAPAIPGAS
jgi:hypothetical protein